MAYLLEALIVRGTPSWPAPIADLNHIIPLNDSAPLGLLPLNDTIFDAIHPGQDHNVKPVLGFQTLTQSVVDLALEASVTAPVAYVHAMFSGGHGYQAAMAWKNGGSITFGPVFTANHPDERPNWHYHLVHHHTDLMAINQVLRFLGIQATNNNDEFDTVGLGTHRFTDEW